MGTNQGYHGTKSLAAKLAAYFLERPNLWIDGRELASIGGAYAWRSRCSQIRYPPFNLRITNRQRHLQDAYGKPYAVSEYRFEPVTFDGQEGATDGASTSSVAV